MIFIIKLRDSNLCKLELGKIESNAYIKTIDRNLLDESKKISIVSDAMFRALFQRDEYIKFPCKLLSYIIDVDYEILLKNLHFDTTEKGKEKAKKNEEFGYRNDLVAVIGSDKVLVEMNNNDSEEIRDRNLSYLMRYREDRKYSNKYNTTILVNLNNYKYEKVNDIRVDFALTNGEILYTNTLFIVDIYLPNIMNECYNELNSLGKFLRVGVEQDIKKALEYAGDDIELKNFVIAGKEKSTDKELLASYDKEEAYGEQRYRNGLTEGHASGFMEGKKEIVKNMLKEKLNIETISRLTGLSKKEIEKFK